MSGRDADALYVAYWSLRDPLTQSQTLPVLRALAAGGRELGLVTYESPAWRMSAPEARAAREDLGAQGIRWIGLRYHKRPPVLATLYDIVRGVAVAAVLGRRWRVRLFHGRGSVASAVAYLAARLTGRLFFNDADGPLSEEYVDAGAWRRGSLGHRLTGWGERLFLRRADAVAVLTDRRREAVASSTTRSVVVLPCAVDTRQFAPDPDARARIRRDFGLSGMVFVYAGKSGGWYLTDAMLDFVAAARSVLGPLELLVLTTEGPAVFERGAADRGLRALVRRVNRVEMPAWLSAADVGLSFVLPAPSKTACSPIKNGEYLACGLPIVTTDEIGDYSALVKRDGVGVVLEGLDRPAYERAARALGTLLGDADLGARCRRAAIDHADLRELVVPRYERIYQSLLGAPSAAPL
jgi:glycosyltransferase involved in cell wall biosynthesis